MAQEKDTGDVPILKQTNEQPQIDKVMETNRKLRKQLEKKQGNYKKVLEMANKNIADLNREKEEYKNKLAVANEKIGNLYHKKDKYKNNLAVANEEIRDLNLEKDQYKNDLAVANEEIGNLKIQLENKEEELKKSKATNENFKDYIRKVQSQKNDGLQIESVTSLVDAKASSTNNLKTPLQKKRPSNNGGSPVSLKRGNGNNDKRKFKESFVTSLAIVDETPKDIKRRKNKVEMARIHKDVLKKDSRFFGSESESEGEVEDQRLYCLKCSKPFDSRELLKQHMETHVNRKVGEEPEVLSLFNCGLCVPTRSFHNAAGIFAHIQSKHTSQNVMNCSFRNCNHKVRVSNKQDLLSHIRSKHTQEKLFQCNKCPKDFSTYIALKDHEKKHASGKQCASCLRFYTLDNCFHCSKKK